MTEESIQAFLGNSLGANGAATFTVGGNQTYLILNDGAAGYQAAHDAIIEITGYSGSLADLEIV
ncbi:MAG: bluetail domain-containing putative surface protein [Leptolyngbyaceae cyanobacterium]